MLQWMEARAERLPLLSVGGHESSGRATVRIVWEVFSAVRRRHGGITSRQHLAEWIHIKVSADPVGERISVQERIVNGVVVMDARGVGLEVAYVNIVLDVCREEPQAVENQRPAGCAPRSRAESMPGIFWTK